MPWPTLPDRACDACTVCCVSLTIEDPKLKKVEGVRCPNMTASGCGIYATRPQTCRGFECGWKMFGWVKAGLRPDRSGVLIHSENMNEHDAAIILTLRDEAALEADGLAETIAAAVAAGRKCYLNVPGPPGFTAAKGRIDKALRPAVLARDKASVLSILREARRKGEASPRVPIRLTSKGAVAQKR